jgi:ABC-type nitrate/sulfonate/bicarbonate transport system ATPase subunit
MTPQIAVSLNQVSFRYPTGVQALESLSLDVQRGATIGIVGPSGCGKSTLLSLVAGLREPAAGAIDIRRYDKSKHPLAMVFQQDTLLPWLTTEGNVKLFYRFKGGNKQMIANQLRELIGMAGLQGFEKSYPYQLSGGMRRRVVFLAAVASTPELLLLDEPFSSLDEPTRVGIHQDVIRIIRRLGMTVVLVTHDLAEAISLCDEVVILTRRPGRVFSRHKIDFGDDRNVLELRQTPRFLELYGTLWRELSLQMADLGP